MSEDQDFLISLQKDFLEEASFLLEQCEESYLKLDTPGLSEAEKADELGKIFRMAHSMKGAGSAVGLTDLAAFAHKVEDCLSVLRAHTDRVSREINSLLLRTGDALKQRVDQLKAGNAPAWDVSVLQAEVEAVTAQLQSGQSAGASTGASDPTPIAPKGALPSMEELEAMVAAEREQEASGQWETLAQETQKHIAPPTQEAPAIAPVIPLSKPQGAPQSPTKGGTEVKTEAQTVKIDAERVESVLNLVGELVVVKSQLMGRADEHRNDNVLAGLMSLMDKTVRELQERALSMRMTPLKPIFLKTQRVIRDLSIKLGKEIDFVMEGEEAEVDRTMVDLLCDPLMHIARNSLDHGIEQKDKRVANGKPAKGTIRLSASQAGGRILIRIQDDGGGISRKRVLQKAIEKNLIPSGKSPESMPDREVFDFIFAAGFSTAEQVTDVSGRGVGMDVVKTNIERLKGRIEIESTEGKGTMLTISIPLTTSITDGMVVRVDEHQFVLPMDSIKELLQVDPNTILDVQGGREIINHRGRIVPIIDLSRQLGLRTTASKKGGTLVLIESEGKPAAIKVSAVVGQTQVVLKGLGSAFEGLRGVAGAAIMSEGNVALVLDPGAIIEAA